MVDPLGSAYKFEEYFGADVLNLEFLIDYSLAFAIFLILAEIMLGVMLMVGYKTGLTIWSLLVISLLFLFLTWYSAYFNKVTDCGCFGDAIQLTPWETFYKNVVLIFAVIFLAVRKFDIHPVYSESLAKYISLTSFILFSGVMLYSLMYLPMIDFRAYAVGNNIVEGMRIPDDAEQPVYEDTWIYNVNGEDRSFTTEEEPWNIEGATFVDRKTRVLKKGFEPPIHDFTMELNGVDISDELLNKERLMLVVAYNLDKSSAKGWQEIKRLSISAMEHGYQVYCFSASTLESFQAIKSRYDLDFDLLFCDETTLKTIVRSNPGVLKVQKGTIIGKWSWREVDKIKFDLR